VTIRSKLLFATFDGAEDPVTRKDEPRLASIRPIAEVSVDPAAPLLKNTPPVIGTPELAHWISQEDFMTVNFV